MCNSCSSILIGRQLRHLYYLSSFTWNYFLIRCWIFRWKHVWEPPRVGWRMGSYINTLNKVNVSMLLPSWEAITHSPLECWEFFFFHSTNYSTDLQVLTTVFPFSPPILSRAFLLSFPPLLPIHFWLFFQLFCLGKGTWIAESPPLSICCDCLGLILLATSQVLRYGKSAAG